jgi:hypothetical protein
MIDAMYREIQKMFGLPPEFMGKGFQDGSLLDLEPEVCAHEWVDIAAEESVIYQLCSTCRHYRTVDR